MSCCIDLDERLGRLRIAVDLDGVLADTIVPWLKDTNLRYGTNLKKEDVSNWGFFEKLGITHKEFNSTFSGCWIRWKEIPPTQDDLSKAVNMLRSAAEVVILTARDSDTLEYAQAWLDHWKVQYDDFVAVSTGREKANFDYDYFVDDSPANFRYLVDANKRVILYDQPWNRNLELGCFARVTRIEDIRRIIS